MYRIMVVAFMTSLAAGQASAAMAAETHEMSHDAAHQGHVAAESAEILPHEPGQSAFAAIAEIVDLLRRDPGTNWDRVDIDGLREHLVDMNDLTLNASVDTSTDANSIAFRVSGEGRTVRAIQSMVPAHAGVLASDLDMNADASLTDDGAVLKITAEDGEALRQLRAFGFFGVMALGAHHQEHHLNMARGEGHAH
jgi:hypothetical protein